MQRAGLQVGPELIKRIPCLLGRLTRRGLLEGANSPKAGWEIGQSSPCPLLSRCPHHAPLCLPTLGFILHPNLGCPPQTPPARHPCLCPRVKGPHQSQPMSSLASPSLNSFPSSHSSVPLILDPSNPSPGPSFPSAPVRNTPRPGSSSLPEGVLLHTKNDEGLRGTTILGQVGQSRTLCQALSPVSAPRPSPCSPSCRRVPVRHKSLSPACSHPRSAASQSRVRKEIGPVPLGHPWEPSSGKLEVSFLSWTPVRNPSVLVSRS